MKRKKIGVYLGAFDPIHEGHLEFATSAIIQNNLDNLYFLVEPHPRHKQGVKSLSHRINMVILGVEDHPMLGTIVSKQANSLDENIRLLQKRFRYHKLILIIPESNLTKYIRHSNIFSEHFKDLNFVIGVSEEVEEIDKRIKLLSETSGVSFKYDWFNASQSYIKTHEIKKQLKAGAKPDRLPTKVYDYIIKQRLYLPFSSA